MEFCPVCMLRQALAGRVESGESSASEDTVKPTPEQARQRFEHYELLKGEDETPVELGRGAMGVTYKALDVDLHCPVTLKVISERYLGDESARLRFLREARAAASVRHPNVASVFHLGRTGQNYFYAMEFVEGETLENLLKRSGRLEVKLALEIATQVAAGLAAVHKQKLVHRDIKPSNIMVSVEEEGAVTAKIIDLGLAKTTNEPGNQTAISMPGAFVGTPDFASPEQFAGVQVDIRSDLYSLGATLWKMLTSQTPFRGTSAELMHQHLHAPLAIDQLKGVPQPVVVLLDVLLEKDPTRRFQNPAELLKAMPAITGAIDAGRRITRHSLQKTPYTASRAGTRKPPAKPGPEKISVARLPVTGGDCFGREEDIAFLDRAWANKDVNVVTIVAWAGVGKSTLVNHWLRRMAVKHYRSAELVFGWSFYRQGSSGETSSADEFLDAALTWFGDSDPRLGTAWVKGERLAKLVVHRRTLLVLDGLEPLQNPPGALEGRLREPSLQALLRELAAFNQGLCVITTRTPLVDIADHAGSSAVRRDLEQLSSDAGAKLLRALGINGQDAEMRSASDEFSGHSLALTLLGSYLTDAYNGDIRCRSEVSGHLAHDVRQGVHARKVMESYQTWFGEGPELSVLRMLGLFDRPVDEKVLGALLRSPAIPGLTESLTDLSPTEWRTILAKLRRARLLAGEDPLNLWQLDTHPLVRGYFGEQLRIRRPDAWKECNRRLYHYYRTLAPQLPNSVKEMEPLFLAVICGCHAGLFRAALHEVYLPRIQQGDASFAAKVLGATGPLLSALIHFFEHENWRSPLEGGIDEQSLTLEDQLFIFMQAAQYLTTTRGLAAPEVQVCYERAESLCRSVDRPSILYVALLGQWRHTTVTSKSSVAMRAAERVYALAQKQNDPALLIGGCLAMAITLYFLGDLEAGQDYTRRGLQVWHSGAVRFAPEEVDVPVVSCLCYEALFQWHFGNTTSCHETLAKAISVAKELNDLHGFAVTLSWAAIVAQFEHTPAEVDRLASELIELCTPHNFVFYLTLGVSLRGWDRTSEALEAINEAEAVTQSVERHVSDSTIHRLGAVFLANLGADETQIEASFSAAIRTAKEQKSVSLAKRAEATRAEYRRQKASASGGRGFRLPLG
jgi:hypothetical protein